MADWADSLQHLVGVCVPLPAVLPEESLLAKQMLASTAWPSSVGAFTAHVLVGTLLVGQQLLLAVAARGGTLWTLQRVVSEANGGHGRVALRAVTPLP